MAAGSEPVGIDRGQGNVYLRSSGPLFSEIDGEVVMVNLDTGAYYALGVVGSRVWELLEAPHDLDGLCAALRGEFDVDAESCHAQVSVFLDELRQAGLVELAE